MSGSKKPKRRVAKPSGRRSAARPSRWSSTGDVAGLFGERLRRMRLRRGWLQVDLAVHSGFGREFISALENGRREPRLSSLKTFAQCFDVTISQMLRGL